MIYHDATSTFRISKPSLQPKYYHVAPRRASHEARHLQMPVMVFRDFRGYSMQGSGFGMTGCRRRFETNPTALALRAPSCAKQAATLVDRDTEHSRESCNIPELGIHQCLGSASGDFLHFRRSRDACECWDLVAHQIRLVPENQAHLCQHLMLRFGAWA